MSSGRKSKRLTYGVLPTVAVVIGVAGAAVFWIQSTDVPILWGSPILEGVAERDLDTNGGKLTDLSATTAELDPVPAPPSTSGGVGSDISAEAPSISDGATTNESLTTDQITDGGIDAAQSVSTNPDAVTTLLSGLPDGGGAGAATPPPISGTLFGGSSSGAPFAGPSNTAIDSEQSPSGFMVSPSGNLGGGQAGKNVPPTRTSASITPVPSQEIGTGTGPTSPPQIPPSLNGGAPSSSGGAPLSGGTPLQSASGGPPPGSSPPAPTGAGSKPTNPITPITTTPGGTAVLPIVSSSGSGANSWEFFDPPVAIGYDYELKPSVADAPLTFGIADIMVTTKVGAGVYDLWLYDVQSGQWVNSSAFTGNHQSITIAADPTANPSGAFDVVSFLLGLTTLQDQELGITDPHLGLEEFSLRGIDPSAGLNPDDPNAFVTGLLFAGSIDGNLFITPLAIDPTTGSAVDPAPFEQAIPEPTTMALFLAGLAMLIWCSCFHGRARRDS